MALISSYSDDAATTDTDRFLTYASDGTTKLTPASNVNKYMGTGWILSGDTWTYSSYNGTTGIGVINAGSGANTKYSVGQWINFSQPTLGAKYAKITALATSSITARFVGGTILSNEAITVPLYSPAAQPTGAPIIASSDTTTLNNPYKFSAYRNAAWNTGTGSQFNAVLLDSVTYDTGSNFNTSTNRFIAPVAGFYWFSGTAGTSTTNIWLIAGLMKNGTVVKKGQGNLNSAGGINSYNSVSGGIQLAASDYVQLALYSNTSTQGGLTGATETFLDGFLLSTT